MYSYVTKDLPELVAKHFPTTEKRSILGHSMGGNIGGLYAGAMPERVRAFVNVEGFGLPDTRPDEAPGRYREWLQQARETPGFRDFGSMEALSGYIASRNPRMSAARARFVAEAWAVATPGGLRLRADPAHKLPNAVLYRRAEAEACWQKIAASVLVVSGSDSEFRGQPFPNSTAVEIEHAGHMLHFETPEALAAAIETFLLDAL